MKNKKLFILILLVLVPVFVYYLQKNFSYKTPIYNIIDVHEHIQSKNELDKFYPAIDEFGISGIVFLGTPDQTLRRGDYTKSIFSGHDENNNEILKIAESDPDLFYAFCTLSAFDSDKLEKFKKCLENGGKGLKLYNGHSDYYNKFNIPLDDISMMEVYEYCEKNKIPILYHINLSKYYDQAQNILNKYPNLIIALPHFGIDTAGLTKIKKLFKTYPNVYMDISFGAPEYTADGFRRIGANIPKYVKFFNDYSGKILFGTDMVVTDNYSKDGEYIKEVFKCYVDLLEEEEFTCGYIEDYFVSKIADLETKKASCSLNCANIETELDKVKNEFLNAKKLKGLKLDKDLLIKIYQENAKSFLNI